MLQNIEVNDYCAIYDCIDYFEDKNWTYKWQPIIKACLCFKDYEAEVETLFSDPDFPNIDKANRNCSHLPLKNDAKECKLKNVYSSWFKFKNLRYENDNLGKNKFFLPN